MISQCEFKPCVGLCADSSEPGACFGFYVSLSLCPSPTHALSPSFKNRYSGGAWVAQSVKCLNSAQVMISRFVSSSPTSDSVLTAQSLEPASDSVSPFLCPCPTRALSLCLSVSVSVSQHKLKKKKKIEGRVPWWLSQLSVRLWVRS